MDRVRPDNYIADSNSKTDYYRQFNTEQETPEFVLEEKREDDEKRQD